jgi:hypothetical protein
MRLAAKCICNDVGLARMIVYFQIMVFDEF